MQNQSQNSVPVCSGKAEETPFEFYAEMRVHAVHPITGAKVELGYDHDGVWIPARWGEGPSLLHDREQLESFLTHPDTLECCDGPLDLEFSRQCVRESIQRCWTRVNEILAGTRPVPDHPLEVWPVNNHIWRVEPGDRIPPGITHIRPVGPYLWQEAAKICSFAP